METPREDFVRSGGAVAADPARLLLRAPATGIAERGGTCRRVVAGSLGNTALISTERSARTSQNATVIRPAVALGSRVNAERRVAVL